MKVKVCGLRETDNINAVVALQPDYIGFICYSRSPRYMVDELSAEDLKGVRDDVVKTGVFVNAVADVVDEHVNNYQFDAIQLHGNESPDFCRRFKGKVTVIKAFGVNELFDFELLEPYADSVDMFLFDTSTPQHGGSGEVFNWDILHKYHLNIPFMLSGGISLENIAEVKKIQHPQLYGVDLNSRFEDKPGLKNIDKLKEAFTIIKQF